MINHRPHARQIGGDDRGGAGERLDQHQTERLAHRDRGEDGDIGQAVVVGQRLVRHAPGEDDAVGETEPPGGRLVARPKVAVADNRAAHVARQRSQGGEQHLYAFEIVRPVEPGNEQDQAIVVAGAQAVAQRSGRFAGGEDARIDTVGQFSDAVGAPAQQGADVRCPPVVERTE